MTSSKLPRFSPPGNLDDLTEENKNEWSSKYISQWINDEIEGNVADREPLPQFFNGTVTPYDQSQKPLEISWNAFPAKVPQPTSSLQLILAKAANDHAHRFKRISLIGIPFGGKLLTQVAYSKTNISSGPLKELTIKLLV